MYGNCETHQETPTSIRRVCSQKKLPDIETSLSVSGLFIGLIILFVAMGVVQR